MYYSRRIVAICLLVSACIISIFADNQPDTTSVKTGGLKFASKDVYSLQRTSLKLFDNFQHIARSFDLRFSCDIYNTRHYGFVFRVMNDFGSSVAPLIHLIYVPPQGNSPNVTFEIHFYQSQTTLAFELDSVSLKDISFNISASARDNTVDIYCNGEHKSTKFDFPRPMNLNFLFGLHGENTDVAPMILHNIRLNLNEQTNYFWPLNEFTGDIAYDRIGRVKSSVTNPIWLQDRHYYWQKLNEISSDPMAGIVMDNNNNIIILNKDSLVIFDPVKRRFISYKYASPRPFDRDAFFAIYNPRTDKIVGYDFRFLRTNDGHRLFSIFDPILLTWTEIDSSSLIDQNHHHTAFWNHDTTELVTFGGYSYFRYYNTFRAFDFDSAHWTNIGFRGDEVYPRTHTAISRSRYTGKYYLYGGFGNKEGSQSMEGRYFYDLYEIKPQSRTIQKIWNLNGSNFDFVPRGNMIFNQDAPVAYVLGNPPVEKSDLRLYQINLEKAEIQIVSDSIPVIFSDMAANAFLFHNPELNELYCVTRETETAGTHNAKISIYRLNFPPSGMITKIYSSEKKSASLYFLIPVILLSLFVLVTFLILIRKRSSRTGILNEFRIKETGSFERAHRNAIWLLNEFRVFDREGHEISYRFATKLRHAFFVLFFENYFNNGISSDDFSNILWPSLNKVQQKNNRGVIMNSLRKIFEDIDGIQLVKENLRWQFKFESAIYIDFLEVHNIIQKISINGDDELLLGYLSLGNLLNNEAWEYLDQFKERYGSAATDILMNMNHEAFHSGKYLRCIEVSDIILSGYDFLNEPALIYKVKSLYLLKNSSKAMAEYNKFRLRYNESISKSFHLSFDDILKTNLPTENY